MASGSTVRADCICVSHQPTTVAGTAPKIAGTASLGYGTYQFTLDSRLDALDPNVALGLFTWSDDPADNHRELDIEFARFGQPTAPIGRYTLQPYTSAGNVFLFCHPSHRRVRILSDGSLTACRFGVGSIQAEHPGALRPASPNTSSAAPRRTRAMSEST